MARFLTYGDRQNCARQRQVRHGPTRTAHKRLAHLWPDSETPDTLVIDLTDRGYVGLGTEGTVAVLEAERVILDRLPILPC
jgi:hypothetical protein